MADTMKFDLVSPERRVATLDATFVEVPGTEGDMTAMPGHTPNITTLRPGVLRAQGPDGTREFIVTGGFAEIGPEGVTVLAEESLAREDVTQEDLDRMVEEARRAHEKAKERFENETGPVDDAAKLLSDMVAMGEDIGMSSRQANL